MDCKHLHLYRHRDMIAIQGEGVPTFYLSAGMCHLLAKSLNEGAFNLLTEKEFPKSNFPDTHLTSSKASV